MINVPTTVAESQPDSAAIIAPVDDKTLAGQSRHDQNAFDALYRRHVNCVYRYLLVRVGDVHEAQDLTAQTFLAALEGICGYRGQGEFAAWLLSIARHKLADHFRRGQATLPLEVAEEMPHPDPPPEDAVAERLRLERVAEALRALAPERAEAVALRIFGGLSATEAGRVMGKSEAAVKKLVQRGMSDLRERLAGIAEVER